MAAQVTSAFPEELNWLKGYLSWKDPQARHSLMFKRKLWDGMRTVWDPKNRTFPTGLASVVTRGAKKANHRVDLTDIRERPQVTPRPVPEGWLRDYQTDAVAAALAPDPINGLRGRGIVQCATGGGKTRIAAAIMWSLPGRWLFLVNSQDLLGQAAEAYGALTSEEAGRVGDGEFRPSRVTAATVQTLLARPGASRLLLESCQGVIADEVHGAASNSFQEVLGKMTNAYYRYGLSATPLGREDHKDLMTVGAIGPIIFRAPASELVESGVLARPTITFLAYPGEPRAYWRKVDALKSQGQERMAFQEAYRLGITDCMARNARVVDAIHESPKPCLAFVKLIPHGLDLKKMLTRVGLKADFVSGKDSREDRVSANQSLVRGDLDVLVASGIYNQGIDIPAVRSLVNAAGGKSSNLALQRLGRGTRKSAGKDEVAMYDFQDLGPWLSRHAAGRRKTYERAGFDVRVG